MDSPPKTKRFWMPGFVVHATRGVLRDQRSRRKMMFIVLFVALALLFCGSSFLHPLLVPHPVWFILYWFACAWFTVTAVLLAVLDLLMTRLQSRAAEKLLRQQYSRGVTPDSQSTADRE